MTIASRVASLLFVALAGCASLPKDVERPPSSALADTGDTRLGLALAPAVAANPGKTAIHALRDGRDAFAARVLLARAAERSLDVQYYIWHDDITGNLLCEALWQAAERGVRVRLLLDDNNTKGLDDDIAALDAHPNIEIRLFNPYANRGWRLGELAVDFSRLNRRMHNKSFTADNQAAIVGGRNIGDEYFGAEGAVAFQDLDVLAAGAVVPEVSAEFDAYWNSASAYPAASLIPAPKAADTTVREGWAKLHEQPEAGRYLDAVRETSLIRDLLARSLQLDWMGARVVSDDPAKVLSPLERTDLNMLPRMQAAVGKPARELDLVSPYFVPTEAGTAALREMAQSGVRVRILTNSLAATDVTPVHAGYSNYREALLRAGVHLYELKPSAQQKSVQRSGIGGSSHASLHAKTFAVDRSRIFVGSFNFDPRSARLNTEMGVVLESPALAARLSGALDAMLPSDAYEVRLSPDGRGLEWIEGDVHHSSEPGVGWLRRTWVGFLSILPIEWLL
jgi:putative cardiolipin synthase